MDGTEGIAEGENSSVYSSIAVDTMSAILEALTDSEKSLMTSEFKRVITDPEVSDHLKETLPYLYIGAFLSLAGREINTSNISKVLSAVGIGQDTVAETLLMKADIKTHLPYLYAYYFLLALGKESTEEEVLGVIESIGISADKERVREVFSFIMSKEKMSEAAQ